jgi:glucosamine-6-phosphate deaminase
LHGFSQSNSMEIIILPDAESAAEEVTHIFSKTITSKPNAVLGLATGSTPIPFYKKLVERNHDWSGITSFNLDEYIGVAAEHPQSYHFFMNTHLFQHVNIHPEKIHIPDGMAVDPERHCCEYEDKIRAVGGIDLQLLGIGSDGHIGFNEPTSSLASHTRIKTLTARTRQDNARFFASENEVPFHVITMGIGTILDTRKVVLLATGKQKALAVAQAVEGPITAMNPASALQLHPSAIFCLDEMAASELTRADYYRWVWKNKPSWQR